MKTTNQSTTHNTTLPLFLLCDYIISRLAPDKKDGFVKIAPSIL